MQPRVGVFGRSFSDTCSIRPPKQNWVLADISELKGQALLGERHRAWVAFISGRNRKCLPRFSKRVSSKRHCGAHNGSTLSNLWKMLQVFLTACSLLCVLLSPPAQPGHVLVPLLCAELWAHGGVALIFAHFTSIAPGATHTPATLSRCSGTGPLNT